MLENKEYVFGGRLPFAMRSCEKATILSITGVYKQISEKWEGLEAMAPTLTLTATSGGSDNDGDW